jgi:hypothetical protein
MRFQIAVSIGVMIVTMASVAVAQQYRIIPVDTDRDMERRVRRLERAVDELQQRVYRLQAEAVPQKRVLCEMDVFGKHYTAYAPTQVEAKEKIKTECANDTNAIHCGSAHCQAVE